MKKQIVSLLFILLINLPLFCGIFDNSNNLSYLESDHFKIIFDNESINEAFLIKDNCEKIYFEICELFNIERTQKINVAITSDIDEFNAYCSIYPTPRIVLYNTIAVNNNFNVFSSDYLLNVFRHELTHALTLTGKNNFIAKNFSQYLNFSLLNITLFNAEGFAILSESQKGEGRLNNNLYRSLLLEASSENKFLKYYESQGNRDIYPSNVFYTYGSFFNKYLIDRFGIDKYRNYINEMYKFNWFFLNANSNFKKIFNIDLWQVYQDFENSFNIVDIKDIKYETLDFIPSFIFKKDNEVFVYQSINNSVINVDTNEKILSLLDGSYYIYADNNKYILSDFKIDNFNKTTTYFIDELNNKKEIQIDNFKMAILHKDSIIGIYNDGQQQYIAFYKDGKIYKKINVEKDEYIQKIDIYNDKIVYLSKYKNVDRINFVLSDTKRKSINFNDKVEIIDFSIFKDKIYLSTIRKNQLTRLAYIDLSNNEAYINCFDTLGGVFSPIVVDDNVYYIAKFFEENKLIKTKLKEFEFVQEKLVESINDVSSVKFIDYDLSKIKKYNKFEHIFEGSFFPFVFPNDNINHLTGLIYFESIDPSETLNSKIFYSQDFYNDFNSSLTLSLSNTTDSMANSFIINYNTKLKDLNNNFDLDLEHIYLKSYDLINNKKLLFKSHFICDDLNTIIGEVGFGYQFSTNIGANRENKFSYLIAYSPIIYYEINTNIFSIINNLEASLYIPYLLPFIDTTWATLNIPFKINYDINLNNLDQDIMFSFLLFKKEIQKSFEKIPLYLNNIETYLNYNIDEKILDFYTVFSSSISQSTLIKVQLYPGFNYTYDINNNKFLFNVGLYSSF